MKKNILNDYNVVSPLEAKHYLLDIPVMKYKYQMNGVRFALKTLYPGNEENTAIDFFYLKNKVIGIAVNSKKIDDLKSSGKKLISSTKLVYNLAKEGIAISICHDWIELIIIENNELIYEQAFYPNQMEECLQQLKKEVSEYSSSIKIYLFGSAFSDYSSFFENLNYEVYNLEQEFSLILKKNCIIFDDNRKKIPYIVIFLFCILISIAALFDLILFNQARIKKQELENIKIAYEKEKNNVELQESFNVDEEDTSDITQYSLLSIFSEIYKSSNSIRILSFSINNNEVKMEADNAKAILVVTFLTNSVLFEDVILNQSIPQDDGSERFIISCRIKNDES